MTSVPRRPFVPLASLCLGLVLGAPACAPTRVPAAAVSVARDTDGDGVEDAQDRCPQYAGPASRGGCPVRDVDEDGVEDAQDACPREAGLPELRGCPVADADRDGVQDAQDRCPEEAGPRERDGCPVRDTDEDGVPDEEDACPTEEGIAELRGCPARDSDGDTVADHQDNCPRVAGPASNQGCPAREPQAVVLRKERLQLLERVYFEGGTATVQHRSFPLLDNVVAVLKAHPELRKVRVEGHTDDLIEPEASRALSQARAEAVMSRLVAQGLAPERLEAQGLGQAQPLESNFTAPGRAANRRIEFILVTEEPLRPAKGGTRR
ncbi:thrombospondin type 3 repeat-containing protein [Corallococcus sp. M34]|uniref:OmpA family protein n=1 Tax=Citreicoccus inhibens TaxID=2849499 RepID=UPI001C247674|nr:OmpA family protein [Citreicoccus inhibens]MBU8897307.1 thrombospondin type 3 repeat-containing protein [Citreicoccus inhibens]